MNSSIPDVARHRRVAIWLFSVCALVFCMVVLGGVTVRPGDVVCADDDGVLVVERTAADWALEQSRARLDKEAATRSRLEAGELGVDFYGLREKLIELGVEYVDDLD